MSRRSSGSFLCIQRIPRPKHVLCPSTSLPLSSFLCFQSFHSFLPFAYRSRLVVQFTLTASSLRSSHHDGRFNFRCFCCFCWGHNTTIARYSLGFSGLTVVETRLLKTGVSSLDTLRG